MPVDRARTAQTLTRVAELEKKLATVEQDAAFDALGPELLAVERELRGEIDADKSEIEQARAGRGVLARLFSRDARQELAEKDLAAAEAGAFKLHELRRKFNDDKMRVHAREFIRVATKVQSAVHGSWETKALAAASRWLNAQTGDAAIAAAAAAGGAPSPAAYAKKSPADVAAVVAALDATGKLPKGGAARATIVDAAVLSPLSPSEAAAVLTAMSAALASTWDGPAPIIAAALLRGTGNDVAAVLVRANDLIRALSGAEGASVIVAAALLAPAGDDVVATAGEVMRSVAGTPAARATIAAAAVLAGRTAGEAVSFAKHVQSQLAGTWESEATIIAAGLLADPGKAAPDVVKRAFLVPGLVRLDDDDA